MQKSSSFSSARQGHARPADLFVQESQTGQSRQRSPSSMNLFNTQTRGLGISVSADPGRPSTQAMASPSFEMPPTPLTAMHGPGGAKSHGSDREQVRLPGVQSLLAASPMATDNLSHSHQASREGQEISMSPSHHRDAMVITPSSERQFYSDRAEAPQPFFPTPARMERKPLSADSFREMPSSNQVQGLGLNLGDETPRLDGQGEWGMRTPKVSSAQRMPDAPVLESAVGGRMSRFMTSPIQPPLRNWNTDLRFEDGRPHTVERPAFCKRSFSDQPRRSMSAAEHQQALALERGMPSSNRAWGLALSMDDGQHYRRGDSLFGADNSLAGPSSMPRHNRVTAAGPPTPVRPSTADNASQKIAAMSASKQRTLVEPSSSNTPMIGKFRVSGLTPHIHKTRLTPNTSTKKSTSPTAITSESPSLKMKSKQRSELLRTQAASVAAQGTLPSDLVNVQLGGQGEAGEHDRPSPVRSISFPASPMYANQQGLPPNTRVVPLSASPRKRQHDDQDATLMRAPPSTSRRMTHGGTTSPVAPLAPAVPSSPWGVFEIHSSNTAWQPLGPPNLSNVLGKLNLDESTVGDEDDDDDYEYNEDKSGKEAPPNKAKRARKSAKKPSKLDTTLTAPDSAPPTPLMALANRPRSTSPTKKFASPELEGKENDVFGSFGNGGKLGGSRRGTPILGNRSSASPTKSEQSSQQQRRLHSIR